MVRAQRLVWGAPLTSLRQRALCVRGQPCLRDRRVLRGRISRLLFSRWLRRCERCCVSRLCRGAGLSWGVSSRTSQSSCWAMLCSFESWTQET